jgi:hypothetical protein
MITTNRKKISNGSPAFRSFKDILVHHQFLEHVKTYKILIKHKVKTACYVDDMILIKTDDLKTHKVSSHQNLPSNQIHILR